MRGYRVSFSGEIGVKAPATRRELENLGLQTLLSRAEALGIPLRVEREGGRLRVELPDEHERLLRTHPGLGRITELFAPSAEELLSPSFWEGLLPPRPFTFVVYVPPIRSRESLSRLLHLKGRLLEILGDLARRYLSYWDNHPPEHLEIHLEGREGDLLLLLRPRRGLGGLPVGSGERVLLLFSGGPDSLLAAVRLLCRGQEVALVFFDDEVPGRVEKVKTVARELAYFLPRARVEFFRVGFREIQEFIGEKVPRRERCFFCKACMLLIAEEVARREGFSAVATGEILGEQASQTLPALLFTVRASKTYPLRPLLGYTKEEVFRDLSELGLSAAARRNLPPCPFVPDHPRTRPRSRPEKVLHLWPEIRKRVKSIGREILSYGG